MSRIGRKPVPIPDGVKVVVEGATVRAQGPRGALTQAVPSALTVAIKDNQVLVSRQSDHRTVRALHGLLRSLVSNMVTGVKDGFERRLDIVGIGYRAQLQGKSLQLALGYSHPILFPLPEGVTAEVEKQTQIILRGSDKALLGQTAATLRALRKPDPYKGKGIRYAGETIRRKVGKKAGAK